MSITDSELVGPENGPGIFLTASVRHLTREIRRLQRKLAEAAQVMRDALADSPKAVDILILAIDAIKAVTPVGGPTTEGLATIRECVRAVGLLANLDASTLADELGEPPIVYDWSNGSVVLGTLVLIETGQHPPERWILRCCPAQGWYEHLEEESLTTVRKHAPVRYVPPGPEATAINAAIAVQRTPFPSFRDLAATAQEGPDDPTFGALPQPLRELPSD